MLITNWSHSLPMNLFERTLSYLFMAVRSNMAKAILIKESSI